MSLCKRGLGKKRTLGGGFCSSSEESTTSEADLWALGESQKCLSIVVKKKDIPGFRLAFL
jgi:hypothetical protein